MQIIFLVFMFVIGAIFGSFFCCQVRRSKVAGTPFLRNISRFASPETYIPDDPDRFARKGGSAGGPAYDVEGEQVHSKKRRPAAPTRSICLHCKKKLKWYDNIPIISWLMLKGKCRFCHHKIGVAEIITELSTALAFLMIATTINVELAKPLDWAAFITTTVFLISIIFLGIYDGITGELPVIGLTISVICAIITLIPHLWASLSVLPLLSALLYGGIYLVLYLVSRGKWVGDGDWILAAAIGLALGHPWLAAVALFVANFSACLIMFPFLKNQKNHQIYFGPFLVLSFVIVYTFSDFFLSMI